MPIDLQPVEPVALIGAITARDQDTLAAARSQLASRLGPIRRQGRVYPFEFTAYYTKEMGENLIKQLVWFEELVDPAFLPQAKHGTMEVEKELGELREGIIRRRANIDPGLVSVESLVLATTKYSGHRICIAPGLYAEVTLLFQQGQYRPQEWTYPDYRTGEVQELLQEIRAHLRQQRRLRGAAP